MGERSQYAWEQRQQDIADAPDIRVLWSKTPVARIPHVCGRCHAGIEAGQKYESVGLTEDGVFRHQKQHFGAYWYPSGCPTFRMRDMEEAAEDYRRDAHRLTNGGDHG